MRNGILVALLSLGLMACGGESDSETHAIDAELSAGIKGIEAQPTLANAEISEGDRASLNTNYTGSVLEDSSVDFSFTLAETKQVAFILSSGAADLDLSINGNGDYLTSTYNDSNELIIFDAQAGEVYSVVVRAWGGGGEFELKFVEANRSSIGLKINEYLVNLESTDTRNCIEDGVEEDEYTDTESSYAVINWSAGYIGDHLGNERTSFSSVDGNAFTINASYSSSEGIHSGSSQVTFALSTNFTTGAITGSSIGSFEYSDGNESGSCTYTSVETGQVIL
jgi:hypothetical protein